MSNNKYTQRMNERGYVHPSNRPDHDNLYTLSAHHPPHGDQVERYDAIRRASVELMGMILALAPECADRSAALRAVREARMWANSAIALEGHPGVES